MKPKERGGIRSKFKDDLRDIRAEAPRATLSRHLATYMDPNIAKRPLFALHQLARLTEYFLYVTRNGRAVNRRYMQTAEDLFFKVRTRQRSVLSNFSLDERLPVEAVQSLRLFVADVLAGCEALYADLHANHMVTCPCCGGKGRVFDDFAERIIAFAKRLVREGLMKRDEIPFELY